MVSGMMFSPYVKMYRSKDPDFKLTEGSDYVIFLNAGYFDKDIYQLTFSNAVDHPSLLESLDIPDRSNTSK
jgi:hypothetical protein